MCVHARVNIEDPPFLGPRTFKDTPYRQQNVVWLQAGRSQVGYVTGHSLRKPHGSVGYGPSVNWVG